MPNLPAVLALFQFFSGLFDRANINRLGQEDLERDIGSGERLQGIAEGTTGPAMLDEAGVPPFRFGGIPVGSQPGSQPFRQPAAGFDRRGVGAGAAPIEITDLFTSADTFQDALPEDIMDPVTFNPLNPDDFRFDPSFIRGAAGDIRAGAATRSDFPDTAAFESRQLGEIADASRSAQELARQEIAAAGGGPAQADESLRATELAGQFAAGTQARNVSADVQELERQISGAIVSDRLSRELGAGTLLGQGESLLASNLGLLANVGQFNTQTGTALDIFNKQFPASIAEIGANLQGADEAKQTAMLLTTIANSLGATKEGRDLGAQLETVAANLISGANPTYSPLSGPFSDYLDFILQQEAIDAQKDQGSPFQLGISPIVPIGGGPTVGA